MIEDSHRPHAPHAAAALSPYAIAPLTSASSMLLPILISILAAVVPTLIYVLIFYWADRYEREPVRLAVIAFFWGAVPAIAVSLLGEYLFDLPLITGPLGTSHALLGNVLFAPIIEETAKWIALLAIFLLRRQEFDGPLDGLIYGALIGFGFAMTENILFFIGAYGSGGYESLGTSFFLRGVVFGMNHAFYTALAGIALGIARNIPNPVTRTLWALAGLLEAIVAHALHNLGVSLNALDGSGFALSLAVAAASLGLIVVTVLWSWQHERAVMSAQLAEEVGDCVTRDEYQALLARWRRPHHLKRRAREPRSRRQLCVELALRKERASTAGLNEPELVGEIEALRAKLVRTMPARALSSP
jgi:RsiW-degrading membrane proteinase PrsW (M82 family)